LTQKKYIIKYNKMWYVKTIDALEGLRTLQDSSVDLVLTSPPYADVPGLNYGDVETIASRSFTDWFIPIMSEINRVLKPSGSFILNINDFCKKGYRDPYIYKLIARSEESGLKFYDTYFWIKKNACPNSAPKRFRSSTEFIFHFVKDRKFLKFHMDRVLEEPCESTKKRYGYDISYTNGSVDGVRTYQEKKSIRVNNLHRQLSICPDGERQSVYVEKSVPYLVRPKNVFNFKTTSASRDNEIKHPAPFNEELPDFFIKLLTDEDDLVVDPFSGIATTGVSCVKTGRNYIGFDLNEKYVEYSKKRIEKYEVI